MVTLAFWRAHVNGRFRDFFELGMTSDFCGNKMFSVDSKIDDLFNNKLCIAANLECIERPFLETAFTFSRASVKTRFLDFFNHGMPGDLCGKNKFYANSVQNDLSANKLCVGTNTGVSNEHC
jgi:hypothetical protein